MTPLGWHLREARLASSSHCELPPSQRPAHFLLEQLKADGWSVGTVDGHEHNMQGEQVMAELAAPWKHKCCLAPSLERGDVCRRGLRTLSGG